MCNLKNELENLRKAIGELESENEILKNEIDYYNQLRKNPIREEMNDETQIFIDYLDGKQYDLGLNDCEFVSTISKSDFLGGLFTYFENMFDEKIQVEKIKKYYDFEKYNK